MAKKVVRLPKPFAHQKAVHNAITENINKYGFKNEECQVIYTVKAQRQVGKTALAISELSRFSLGYSDLKSAYIAPTFKLGKKVFDETVKIYRGTGLIASSNKTDMYLQFVTGGSINFFSAEQRDNLRGFTVTGIMVIDECAFIRDDIYYECLTPWVDFHNARTLLISTPKFKRGFFYDAFCLGEKNQNSHISVDFCNFDMSCIRSKASLEQKRKLLPTMVFLTEYLGQFIDALSEVFGKFDHLVMDDIPSIENAKELYFGLDWGAGTGADETSLIALNEFGEECFHWETNDMSPVKQAEYVKSIYDKHRTKIKSFKVELNSIGKIYFDMIKKNRPLISGFTTTNDTKRELVEKLQVSFQNDAIRISSDVEKQMQLSMYKQTVNEKTNIVTYNAPSGYHDDRVMSLMLANSEFSKRTKKKYNLV